MISFWDSTRGSIAHSQRRDDLWYSSAKNPGLFIKIDAGAMLYLEPMLYENLPSAGHNSEYLAVSIYVVLQEDNEHCVQLRQGTVSLICAFTKTLNKSQSGKAACVLYNIYMV